MTDHKIYIYGKHAIEEALKYPENLLQKVHFASYFDDESIRREVKNKNISTTTFSNVKNFKGVSEDSAHQGVVAELSLGKLLKPYKEFINDFDITDDTSFVILGELNDPQNVGAVIRSAGGFGVAAVLISDSAPLTSAAIKVSAGMAFQVPLVSISNINSTAEDLKKRGFWIYGLEGDSKNSLKDEKFEKPSAFILGNEATGIREKTKEVCDILLSIPIHPRCESLNVAASAAAVLYEWSKNHTQALK